LKLQYMGIQNVSRKWTMPSQNKSLTISHLALFLGEDWIWSWNFDRLFPNENYASHRPAPAEANSKNGPTNMLVGGVSIYFRSTQCSSERHIP